MYQLLEAPTGASLDPSTGAFQWQPDESQGPSTNQVSVAVTDAGTPPLSATNSFLIVVSEVNQAPVVMPVADQILEPSAALQLTVNATDADLPANKLGYQLVTGPPGMMLGPDSAVLSRTPSEQGLASTNEVVFRVSDDGIPPLSTESRFNVVVRSSEPLGLTAISLTGDGGFFFSWAAQVGRTYQVQFKDNLAEADWQDIEPPNICQAGRPLSPRENAWRK